MSPNARRGIAHLGDFDAVGEPMAMLVEQMWGSGDKQASAKLCCVEIEEVAVAFGPPS
jgi:hypothetical protein